jgi:chromosome segregation protein
MLKALELAGFKSFADRTRFEFPAGITVIVGPNGSGKSNIVDAIKWVLGEQSAKSLRGKDMADVIFKGSGPRGRKVLNTAEATIVFDNADGRLAVDAPEVHVTRRVYRSGEGEYLINRQPCRLKDVRDLFRGTGVGTDAYSLIEQGKVDRLLQASPRDRRAIFEEAAGISRFKAKKIEAQRRLDRVQQNLLRLSDIVDEVASRLRSVRSQASKAKRYREYSDRLQQLRTQIGLTEWRRLSEKLGDIEDEIARVNDAVARLSAELTADEARGLELETEIVCEAELIREREHRFARNRETIAARNALVQHQQQRIADLEEEASHCRLQLATLTGHAGDLGVRLQQAREVMDGAQHEFNQVSAQLAKHDQAVARLQTELQAGQTASQRRRQSQLAVTRRIAELQGELTLLESRRKSAEATCQRCEQLRSQLDADMQQHREQLATAQSREAELTRSLGQLDSQLESHKRELAEDTRLLTRRREELAVQQGRLGGARERIALLEQLEQQNEGLTTGVQHVLEQAASEAPGELDDVLGLVADVLQVPMQWAPLVDAALGSVSQHVILASGRVLESLESGRLRPTGRVGFIALNESTPARDAAMPAWVDSPGVLGRLDQLIDVDPKFQPLAERLLGHTWAVEMLQHARALRRQGADQVRFVTLAGEVVERDGTVVAGPKEVAGLVSRRTELRELRLELTALEGQVSEGSQESLRLQENIDRRQVSVRRCADDHAQISNELADCRVQVRTLGRHLDEHEQRRQQLAEEQDAAVDQLDGIAESVAAGKQQSNELTFELKRLETRLEEEEQTLQQQESELAEHQQHAIAIQVERAKREQHLVGLKTQVEQLESDRQQRSRAIEDAQSQLASATERRALAQRRILDAGSELALLYIEKESLQSEILANSRRREELIQQRRSLLEQIKSKQSELGQCKDKLHQRELAAGAARHDRDSLEDRLREDYGIEIAELEQDWDEQQQQQREEVEQEIDTLRRRISNIGAVNMEALNELDDLEARHASLSGQYQDLVGAKESLERIIQRINVDSRRLFSETLENIRSNFQALYRRAFGGGSADIVLEEGVDVLECGIDIVARPPGKPSFSNSLLSGGEKALTAVALLLAIFQYRPSPFCVLDEVDAPFDEANIGRFVEVLEDFLGWTKFVLVTHSKKTMTAATTLYGVTMQESGVSKQVSVRFEDVSEDGEISAEAVERSTSESDDDERGAA